MPEIMKDQGISMRRRRRCHRQRRRCLQSKRRCTVRQYRVDSTVLFGFLLFLLRRFLPMEVTAVRVWGISPETYPVCPACDGVLEREYQSCCEHCGQRLGWREFRMGRITFQDRRPPYTGDSAIPYPKKRASVDASCVL